MHDSMGGREKREGDCLVVSEGEGERCEMKEGEVGCVEVVEFCER